MMSVVFAWVYMVGIVIKPLFFLGGDLKLPPPDYKQSPDLGHLKRGGKGGSLNSKTAY